MSAPVHKVSIRTRSGHGTPRTPTTEAGRGVAQGGPDSRPPRQKGRKARSHPETVNGFHNGAPRAGVAA